VQEKAAVGYKKYLVIRISFIHVSKESDVRSTCLSISKCHLEQIIGEDHIRRYHNCYIRHRLPVSLLKKKISTIAIFILIPFLVLPVKFL
jgi:hypothetical protein